MLLDCQVRDSRENRKPCFLNDIKWYIKMVYKYSFSIDAGRLQAGQNVSNITNAFNVHVTFIICHHKTN